MARVDRSGRTVFIGMGSSPVRCVGTAGIRYPGDDDPDVALVTETLVPELVAADVWRRQA